MTSPAPDERDDWPTEEAGPEHTPPPPFPTGEGDPDRTDQFPEDESPTR